MSQHARLAAEFRQFERGTKLPSFSARCLSSGLAADESGSQWLVSFVFRALPVQLLFHFPPNHPRAAPRLFLVAPASFVARAEPDKLREHAAHGRFYHPLLAAVEQPAAAPPLAAVKSAILQHGNYDERITVRELLAYVFAEFCQPAALVVPELRARGASLSRQRQAFERQYDAALAVLAQAPSTTSTPAQLDRLLSYLNLPAAARASILSIFTPSAPPSASSSSTSGQPELFHAVEAAPSKPHQPVPVDAAAPVLSLPQRAAMIESASGQDDDYSSASDSEFFHSSSSSASDSEGDDDDDDEDDEYGEESESLTESASLPVKQAAIVLKEAVLSKRSKPLSTDAAPARGGGAPRGAPHAGRGRAAGPPAKAPPVTRSSSSRSQSLVDQPVRADKEKMHKDSKPSPPPPSSSGPPPPPPPSSSGPPPPPALSLSSAPPLPGSSFAPPQGPSSAPPQGPSFAPPLPGSSFAPPQGPPSAPAPVLSSAPPLALGYAVSSSALQLDLTPTASIVQTSAAPQTLSTSTFHSNFDSFSFDLSQADVPQPKLRDSTPTPPPSPRTAVDQPSGKSRELAPRAPIARQSSLSRSRKVDTKEDQKKKAEKDMRTVELAKDDDVAEAYIEFDDVLMEAEKVDTVVKPAPAPVVRPAASPVVKPVAPITAPAAVPITAPAAAPITAPAAAPITAPASPITAPAESPVVAQSVKKAKKRKKKAVAKMQDKSDDDKMVKADEASIDSRSQEWRKSKGKAAKSSSQQSLFSKLADLGGRFRERLLRSLSGSLGGSDGAAARQGTDDGDRVPWRRAKVLIVGQENVGKTSLLLAMKRRRRATAGSAGGGKLLSTDGIDLHRISMKLHGEKITFSVFDFAGQTQYYTSHSFFLSKERSFYIVAFNCLDGLSALSDSSRLIYWLNSIRTQVGPSVEILVVGTHWDRVGDQEQLAALFQALAQALQRFRIYGYYAVSSLTGDGVASLKSALAKLAVDDPTLNRTLHRGVIKLEQQLYKLRDNQLQQQQPPLTDMKSLWKLADELKIPASEFQEALRLFHALGICLHYGKTGADEQLKRTRQYVQLDSASSSSLDELVILGSQWVIDLMATLLSTSHSFARRSGLLKQEDVRQIWASYAPRHDAASDEGGVRAKTSFPESLHAAMLALLESFELVVPLTTTAAATATFVIPALLPEEQPAEYAAVRQRLGAARHTRSYWVQFLPVGVVPRLLARFLRAGFAPVAMWRGGALFRGPRQDEALHLSIRLGEQDTLFVLDVEVFEEQTGSEREDEGDDGKRTEAARAKAKAAAAFFRFATGTVRTLLTYWYASLRIELAAAPCPQCGDRRAFPLGRCELAVSHGYAAAACPSCSASTALASLVPDVALVDFAEFERKRAAADLHVERELARGAFGLVALAKSGEFGRVAVKRLLAASSSAADEQTTTSDVGKEDDDDDEAEKKTKKVWTSMRRVSDTELEPFRDFVHEVCLLLQASSPWVVGLYAFSFCPQPTLALEYLAGGSLYGFLHDKPGPGPLLDNWPLLLGIALDVAEGMRHLHSLSPKIVHGDLKSPNVLLGEVAPARLLSAGQWKKLLARPTSSASLELLQQQLGVDTAAEAPKAAARRLFDEVTAAQRPVLAKIADFGLSSVLYFEELEWSSETQNPIWLAPEGLATEKADAYSFAIVLYELVSCSVPYHEHHFDFVFQLQEAIHDGLRPEKNISKSTPVEVLGLMTRAWSLNPADRPTFEEIVPVLRRAHADAVDSLSRSIK